jgi:tetratricopeptide (TPR) repeat protein
VDIELSKGIFQKFHTIEELEKYIQEHKDNYKAYIKLAQKYNEIKEYDTAKIYFQTALKMSERSNYALYAYSMFCIEQQLYNHALAMAEEITLQNKKTIRYKAKIYESLAESFDKKGEIQASTKAYQVALKYANETYDKKSLDELKTKYALEYAKLADIKIEHNEKDSAILDIKNSLRIKETPIAKYKLALLYKDTKKRRAEKMISGLLEEKPYIINPYIYNKLLNDLLEEARQEGNTPKINYYTKKIQKYKKFLSEIYIFNDDIKVSNIDIFPRKTKILGREEIVLVFDLINNTEEDIQDLYLYIELFYGNKNINLEKTVASKTNIFEKETTRANIETKLPSQITKDDIILASDVLLKIYAKKQKKAPWTLIKIKQFK